MLSGALSDQDEEDVLAELDSIIKEQTKETEPAPTVPEEVDIEELPEVPSEEPEEGKCRFYFHEINSNISKNLSILILNLLLRRKKEGEIQETKRKGCCGSILSMK